MSDQNHDQKIAQFKPRELEKGPLEKSGMKIGVFQPKQFGSGTKTDYSKVKEQFGSFASTDPKSNQSFKLQNETSRLLGVDSEEKNHVDELVQAEVAARVSEIEQRAYRDGLERGLAEGKATAQAEYQALNQPVYERFFAITQEFENQKNDIFAANELVLVNVMFQVAKQVLLRELKTDTEYLKKLAALVVEKVGAKDHVRIKLSHEDFAQFESVRDFLKVQFPDLKNIQIEPSADIVLGGCRVETDLSRIDASVETQLSAIETSLSQLHEG